MGESSMRRCMAGSIFVSIMLASVSVSAQDQWSEPALGVSYLLRTAPGPLRMHAAVVDLTRDDLYIRATRPEERGATTTAFAQQVGAVVAINGDWFGSGFQPVGLAVGQGAHWEGTADQGWAFIACTVERDCVFGDHPVNQELYWRWYDVVGGNGWRLVIDGQIPTYPPDAFYTDRHPRSAVGISADGNTMIFAVVEGRRADSIGIGFHDFAAFMQELGAHQALMLDGGGSSALTINQSRVNQLPANESGERTVANHLAILRGQADPRCASTPNGRYCEGSSIHTCQGGAHQGEGDCAFFGASCDVTSDGVGVCTHLECVNGPENAYCESDTVIMTCAYGRPDAAGDCSAYGATCADDGDDEAFCLHYLCTEGGNARWCGEGEILHECVAGQPQDDIDCAETGRVCSGNLPGCVEAICLGREHETFCVEDEQIRCEDGLSSSLGPCGSAGDTGRSDDDDDASSDTGESGGSVPNADSADTSSCAGCAASGSAAPWWSFLMLVAVLRRRRAPTSS
jgi:uncharacterized protein (TIGR03382 family)